jgi:1-acyl-sn-glycerol-3-phosphate acyltransferase
MYKFLKSLINVLAHIFFRIKIVGKENIPNEGSAILCGNHIHALDSVLLIANTKRKINFMAKKILFNNWFMRWIQKPFGLIPVDREKNDIEAIKKALKVLKNGEILGIFPEGTRNGLAKNVEVKDGVAYFAIKTGVQVIPVGIRGTFKPFSKIIYNIGAPLDFSEYVGKKVSKEDLDNITNIIMDKIIDLTNQKN